LTALWWARQACHAAGQVLTPAKPRAKKGTLEGPFKMIMTDPLLLMVSVDIFSTEIRSGADLDTGRLCLVINSRSADELSKTVMLSRLETLSVGDKHHLARGLGK
jgi:hypothetical protein